MKPGLFMPCQRRPGTTGDFQSVPYLSVFLGETPLTFYSHVGAAGSGLTLLGMVGFGKPAVEPPICMVAQCKLEDTLLPSSGKFSNNDDNVIENEAPR